MKTVEWRGKVRITVGEITRAGQLQLSRNVNFGTENNIDLMAEIAEELACAATRKIELCIDGEWVKLTRTEAFTLDHDGDELTFVFPPTADSLRALPVSITNEWLMASGKENEYLQQILFFGQGGGTSTTNTSAPPSDSAQSSEQGNERSPMTTETGTTAMTPNTSLDGS